MSKRWQSSEKRQFRRIKNSKDNPLRITINKETAEAALQDYSILGAGVQADSKILSAVGRTIEVFCKYPDFHCEAKVIWHGGQKIGLSLARNVEGSLSVFTAPDIFTGLCGTAETGVLEFRKGQSVRKIYLQQGNIVFSSSNQVEDSLGDMLLREGTITRQQYEKSVELLKTTGGKQGAILVKLGALTPNDMIKAVYRQLEEICLGVFSLCEGSFLFHDGPLPDNLLRLKISAPDLIYRGLKRTAGKDAVFEAGLREDSVIAPFSYPLHLFQAMKIPAEDKMIMSLADGRRRLSEIVKEAPFPESKTLQTIYALLYARTLELKDPPETSPDTPEESREDAGSSKPATARGAYTGKVEGPLPAADARNAKKENTNPINANSEDETNITKEQITRIDEMHRMLEKYDHYEMLGLWDKKAEPSEIKKAYYKAAREFHPDKNFHMPKELMDKLNVIFSRVSLAYTNLIDPTKRINYDASLRPGASVKLAPDPKSASENFKQGRVYYSNNDFKKAEVFFTLAAGLDPKKPEYLFYYGSTLARLGNYKEAVKILHRALPLDREDPAITVELGLVYLKLGLPERAEFYLKQALQKDPSNRRVIDGLLKIKNGPRN